MVPEGGVQHGCTDHQVVLASQTETRTNSFDGYQGARNAHQEHMSVRTKTVTCASLDAELLASGSDWGVWDRACQVYYATYFALITAS